MLARIFALIDRVRPRVVFLWLGGLIVALLVMLYSQVQENAANHAAYIAELGAKCRVAGYTPAQCEFIITLADRPGITGNAGPDAATMAAIHAATAQ